MKRTSLSFRGGRHAACVATIGCLAALSGCGGIGPGDYVYFRVAYSDQVTKTPGCFNDEEVPANEAEDRTDFRTSATFILFASTVSGPVTF